MENKLALKDPQRWGLDSAMVTDFGQRVYQIWSRFRDCFTTCRHDTSENAQTYLKGLLTMPKERNYKKIARSITGSDDDGQNLQHFMSDSPWLTASVFRQIKTEIGADKRLHGGGLSLDDSGDRCSGPEKAGASRQYIGSEGKVDMGQVGVCLGYYATTGEGASAVETWTMVDAELFLPEVWFDEAHKAKHSRLHIPQDREYQTKLEIGLSLIDRARSDQLPFTHLTCDSWYGCSHEFRAELAERDIPYLADIHSNQQVYLEKPEVGVPTKVEGAKGRPPTRWQVLNNVQPVKVCDIARDSQTVFQPIRVRSCERGDLVYSCAERTVWTITEDGVVRRERLFMRKEHDGSTSYSLSNAGPDISISTLALWRSERYFVERIFQDAKSELGWDELEARKYRAWMHHSALIALCLWFFSLTKLDWMDAHPRDESLVQELGIDKLPALSLANVRLLLQVVMPIKALTVDEAIELVATFLYERSCSTRSRLKTQRQTDPQAFDTG